MNKKKVFTVFALLIIIILIVVAVIFKNKNNKEYFIGIGQLGESTLLDNCKNGILEGLKEKGFVEGKNLRVEYQSANFDTGVANLIAESFVTKKVDLCVGITTTMSQAIFNSASENGIPTVFAAVTDPKTAGLTDGNITGTSDVLEVDEQLKLVREILPNAKKIGVLYTTSESNSSLSVEQLKEVAGDFNFEIVSKGISQAADIPLALDSLLRDVDCFINLADNTVTSSIETVLEKTNEYKIPFFSADTEAVKSGCIAASGIDYKQLGIQTGKMVAKILKGEDSAENMDFESISECSIYINSETFKKLDIEIPETLKEKAIDVLNNEV